MNNRHQRILKIQARIAAAVFALISVFTLVGVGIQAREQNSVNNEIARSEKIVQLYEKIDGKTSIDSSRATDKLAIDLKSAIGERDPTATQLPEELEKFNANPNKYSGIQSETGLSVFDNTGLPCEECGPLAANVRDALLRIKRGEIDQLVSEIQVTMPVSDGIQLAPFSIPLPLWAGIVYLTTTVPALVIAVRIDSRKHNYRAESLNWKPTGIFATDRAKTASKLISPIAYTYYILPLPWKKGSQYSYRDVLVRLGLDDEYDALQRVLSEIQNLGPKHEKYSELRNRAAELSEHIESTIANHGGSRVNTTEVTTGNAAEDIEAALRDLDDRLRSQRKAWEDVNDITSDVTGKQTSSIGETQTE
jgi:hypothetical protein